MNVVHAVGRFDCYMCWWMRVNGGLFSNLLWPVICLMCCIELLVSCVCRYPNSYLLWSCILSIDCQKFFSCLCCWNWFLSTPNTCYVIHCFTNIWSYYAKIVVIMYIYTRINKFSNQMYLTNICPVICQSMKFLPAYFILMRKSWMPLWWLPMKGSLTRVLLYCWHWDINTARCFA